PGVASVAERAAAALGLDYAGVDILDGALGPQVIEVNGNPSFDWIWDALGQDMGVEIAQHVGQLARARRAARKDWADLGAGPAPPRGP
ncbi:MAG: hypothetical protein HY901_27790, partial [Deltaproteobacteria bacterium]|nr:hypothetical protein [Deltaproteobacteria bacterium]